MRHAGDGRTWTIRCPEGESTTGLTHSWPPRRGLGVGRRREDGVQLPEGVEKVRAKGRTYYYWNPHRGTSRQGERIRLPNADSDPIAFWREVKRYCAQPSTVYP
jgi:hypothetical protein